MERKITVVSSLGKTEWIQIEDMAESEISAIFKIFLAKVLDI